MKWGDQQLYSTMLELGMLDLSSTERSESLSEIVLFLEENESKKLLLTRHPSHLLQKTPPTSATDGLRRSFWKSALVRLEGPHQYGVLVLEPQRHDSLAGL